MLAAAIPKRIAGLDTLRLLLASWVVFGHLGTPLPVPDPSSLPRPLDVLAALYSNAFNAPAAVICFFVISGFCIHFPFRGGQPLELLPYFARRHVRIWIPIVVAIALAKPLQVKLYLLHDSILWSLVCEEIYYLLYPALAALARRWSWDPLLAAAFAGAFAVAATHPTAVNYPSYGIEMNWILGLPCWLLGCRLAARIDPLWEQSPPITAARIWTWRMGIIAAGTALSLLRYHGSIGYPWSLTLASPLAYLWICREILYRRHTAPLAVLETLGLVTYSLYLTHLHGREVFQRWVSEDTSTLPTRLGVLLSTLLCAGLFYGLVENPSHRAARGLARWLTQRRRTLSGETGFGSERVVDPAAAPAMRAAASRRSLADKLR